MSAKVTVDQAVWTELRFKMMAQKLNLSIFDVVGRCTRLWAECTHRGEHWLSEGEINLLAEYDNFAGHLVEFNLAFPTSSPSAGSRSPYGGSTVTSLSAGSAGQLIYLRGTKGRIEWLDHFRKQAPRGGKARANGAERDKTGRFKKNNNSTGISSQSAGARYPAHSNPSNAMQTRAVNVKSIPPSSMNSEQFEARRNYLLMQGAELMAKEASKTPTTPAPQGPGGGSND